MSDVYEAVDEQNGQTVALKIVRSNDPEFVRRLTLEARALEKLSHPGLITLLDTGLSGNDAYLVMAFIDGPTLAASLTLGPLGAPETAALGARLADALAYVHAQGIVHRDVKPSNILQSSAGEAWLGDFGIAQHHDATTMTAAGSALGTVVYMAPEQLEGERVGPSADIWSLGIVLLECLTGRRVYEGTPSEIVARRMTGPLTLPVELPAPWKVVLNGMLVYRPDDRLTGQQVATLLSTSVYATPWLPPAADATELVGAVGASDRTVVMPGSSALAASGDETLMAPPPRRTTVPPSRPPWLIPVGVLALAALVVGLFFLLSSNTPATPTTTTSRSTTTTSTTTTTTPTTSSSLANLLSELTSGQKAGDVDPNSEQSISQDAQQALFDASSGNAFQAESDLQQAESVIAGGEQSGTITQGEADRLQRALATYATALDLIAPSTTTTTTPTTPGPPGNNGNGPGKGNGPGNSN
jgi:serine/threonine protein kinase